MVNARHAAFEFRNGNLYKCPVLRFVNVNSSWWLDRLNDVGEHASHTRSSLLSPRCFCSNFVGHTLSIDGGDGIFLDVMWLSKCLKPILSHKLRDHPFDNKWLSMRDALVRDGILRRDFALHLWSEHMTEEAMQSAEAKRALFSVLIKLGVALPLGYATLSADDRHVTAVAEGDPQDMLVVMRLPELCNDDTQRRCNGPAAAMPQFDREVTLKWKFDSAGPPYGLVERLIASCHVLGKVEAGACWRYGAKFNSHFKRGEGNVRLYKVALDMTSYHDAERVLTARVFGPLGDKRVWVAIRHVASAMVNLSKEWRGVLWE